ncbi:hypothetical protein [Streptomyces sp. SBT349]|nr:hypothetical protein [Streptomyces sp. SBT349]
MCDNNEPPPQVTDEGDDEGHNVTEELGARLAELNRLIDKHFEGLEKR